MTNVYFIGNIDLGFVKIGKSDNPEKRLNELQTGNPYKLTLYGKVEDVSDDYETYIHRLFRKNRVNGEWFKITDELIAFMMFRANNQDLKGKFEAKTICEVNEDKAAMAVKLHDEIDEEIHEMWRETVKEKGWDAGLEINRNRDKIHDKMFEERVEAIKELKQEAEGIG